MIRVIAILGCIVLAMSAEAQTTNRSIQLSDSIVSAEFEWADLNNDGLLDVVLFMKAASSNDYIGIIKGDSTDAPLEILKTFPVISYRAYLLTDFDRDNAMDILVSGQKNGADTTVLYRNKGAFDFEENESTLPEFTTGHFADLDSDATPELVVSGSDAAGFYTRIVKQFSDGSWVTVHDSLKLNCSSIESLDADGDGDSDLFLSGKLSDGKRISGFFLNKGNFYFQTGLTTPLSGRTSSGDFNGDGFFEIVLMAEDDNASWHTKKFQIMAGTYTISDLPLNLRNGKPFIADIDYDGVPDVNYYGINALGDTINVIEYSSGSVDAIESHRLRDHGFGDIDHNGNLELITLTDHGNLELTLSGALRPARNLSPGDPFHAVALPIFNRVFMYWDKPADDHTPMKSLTYDVFLNGALNYLAGEFDLMNEKRLAVTHGNNGTRNFNLLKHVDPKGLKFSIQAIDNSFHAGNVCLGGVGTGSGTGSGPCVTVSTEEISVCTSERITFKAPGDALWFSFADGFKGIGVDYSFATDSHEKGDTIFYYHPMGDSCSSLKAWTIKVRNDTIKVQKDEKYACAESSVDLNVEPGWETISWSSQKLGNLGSSNSISYSVTQPDSVFVTLSNSLGCELLRKTAIKLSKPDLKISADHIKIMRGGDVQLQASGAQRYVWSPATALSQIDIPNPVASPSTTIQYVVTGFDSLDCSAQATITVTVESTGFIPNLFSPNDDGQNDQLKVYGVASVERFTLSIYDREGSLVYKTSDLSEALHTGWDGTKNGTKQPPGVYFWKVKGELSSGQLLLNGKDSGSIVLIR